jgi:hypothetical protein
MSTILNLSIAAWLVLRDGPRLQAPTAVIVFLTAGVASAAFELWRDRGEQLSDDEFLFRQLSTKKGFIWPTQGAWFKRLGWFLALSIPVMPAVTLLTHEPWAWWWWLGLSSGLLAGYPHWRKHWRRLRELAASEERLAVLGEG